MKILITGITGFIGGHLCQKLIDERRYDILASVRPKTEKSRYARFLNNIRTAELDLDDEAAVDRVFSDSRFDCVFHMAACRGAGSASKKTMYRSNIMATSVLGRASLKYGARFIFCSSVGVFGTIPSDLPATEDSPLIGDNYYHYTKIEAERSLLALQNHGLRLTIIRPAITYGIHDRGFPFLLIKLTDMGLIFLPKHDIHIHMVDVRTLVDAFIKAAHTKNAEGKAYILADKIPVSLRELVSHISIILHGSSYPSWKVCPDSIYRLAENIFLNIIRNEAWTTRIRLISRNWYYDASFAEKELYIDIKETVPNLDYVIEWYRKSNLD